MSVPTPYVVLSFSKDPMLKLFSLTKADQAQDFLASINESNKDVFVFGETSTNNNLISLEHSLGLGNQMQIDISFIDPKNEFERRFMSTNLLELTGASLVGKKENTEAENNASQQEQLRRVDRELSKAYRRSELAEYGKNFGDRIIYVAYGLGGNLRSWAGPFKCILKGTRLDIRQGKLITIQLVTMLNGIEPGEGLEHEEVRHNLEGLRQHFTGKSQIINIDPDSPQAVSYTPEGIDKLLSPRSFLAKEEFKTFTSDALEEHNLEVVSDYIDEVDIHTIVVDTLRDYIRKVTRTDNVIVLLPNINWICRYGLQERIRATEATESETSIWRTSKQRRVGASYRTLIFILESLGLELTSDNRGHPDISGDLLYFMQRNTSLPAGQIVENLSIVGATSGTANIHDVLQEFSNSRNFYAKKQTTIVEDQTPQHEQAITEIINGIREFSKSIDTGFRWASFYESNLDILNIWKDYAERTPLLFGGKSMEIDDDGSPQPVVVCGDIGLIDRFLYGSETTGDTAEGVNSLRERAVGFRSREGSLTDELTFLNAINQATMATEESLLESISQQVAGKQQTVGAAINLAPLHPNEAPFLQNEEYNTQIRSIVHKPKEEIIGPFGSISNIPDTMELSFEEVLAQAGEAAGGPPIPLDVIAKGQVPVFVYNYDNPNVLDLKLNIDSTYLALLNTGFKKEFGRLASNTVGGVYKDRYLNVQIRDMQQGVDWLGARHRMLGFVPNGYSGPNTSILDELRELYGESLPPAEAQSVYEAAQQNYRELLARESNQPFIGLDFILPGNADSISAQFAEQLYRQGVQAQITTLPMFHLTNNAVVVNGMSILLARDAPITGSDLSTRSNLNYYMSGYWGIVGFKHTIKGKTIESKFRITKNIPQVRGSEEDNTEGMELSPQISPAIVTIE